MTLRFKPPPLHRKLDSHPPRFLPAIIVVALFFLCLWCLWGGLCSVGVVLVGGVVVVFFFFFFWSGFFFFLWGWGVLLGRITRVRRILPPRFLDARCATSLLKTIFAFDRLLVFISRFYVPIYFGPDHFLWERNQRLAFEWFSQIPSFFSSPSLHGVPPQVFETVSSFFLSFPQSWFHWLPS